MKTFKIFLEDAAENLEALRASSEERKQLALQRINKQRQQKIEDEELEKTIDREIEEREKAAKIKENPQNQKTKKDKINN